MLVRDDVRAALSQSGMTAASASTPAEFTASLNREFETWLSVVRSANIKPE
jgi:tripartite-type tricarboxylate transporter receptor subunit TctC